MTALVSSPPSCATLHTAAAGLEACRVPVPIHQGQPSSRACCAGARTAGSPTRASSYTPSAPQHSRPPHANSPQPLIASPCAGTSTAPGLPPQRHCASLGLGRLAEPAERVMHTAGTAATRRSTTARGASARSNSRTCLSRWGILCCGHAPPQLLREPRWLSPACQALCGTGKTDVWI